MWCVGGCDTGCGIKKVSCVESWKLIVRCCSQGLVLTSCGFSFLLNFFFF